MELMQNNYDICQKIDFPGQEAEKGIKVTASFPEKRIFILEFRKTIKMKKNTLYAFLAAILTLCVSCDGMDAPYEQFIEDGPIIYIGKADSLEAFAGRNRIKLFWQMRNDPRGVEARIYWKDHTDSVKVTLDRSQKVAECIIDSLQEASYVFEVIIYDKYGHSSLPVEITGEVYGDIYLNYLNPRSYTKKSGKAVYYNKDTKKWEMILNMIRDETLVNTEVVYINENGEEKTLSWSDSASYTFTLEGYKEGNPVKYRSCFLPQEGAIDEFWTDYTYLAGE